MKVKVMYHTRKGNTEKVAHAIAQTVGLKTAELVPPAYLPENLELLFLGGGLYAGKIDKTMEKFIHMLNPDRVRNVALFGTTGGQDKGIQQMKELLEKQGINVLSESFLCKGRFFVFFNRKHPNEIDLQEAQSFAKRVVEKLKNEK